MSEAVWQRIYGKISEAVELKARKVVEKARRVVVDAVHKEANQIFKWVAAEMRSGLSGPPSELTFYGAPSWAAFSSSYIKTGPGYFNETGELARLLDSDQALRAFAPSEGADFDEVSFGHRGASANVSFDKLKLPRSFHFSVKTYKNLSEGTSNSDLALLVAAAVGDKRAFYKMTNGSPYLRRPERPFLLPALLYFAKSRVPLAAREALRKAGFTVR